MATVANNSYYTKEFAPTQVNEDSNILQKAGSFLENAALTRYFTPPGLYPIKWPKKNQQRGGGGGMGFNLANMSIETKKDVKTQLGELAHALGVDAVVTI